MNGTAECKYAYVYPAALVDESLTVTLPLDLTYISHPPIFPPHSSLPPKPVGPLPHTTCGGSSVSLTLCSVFYRLSTALLLVACCDSEWTRDAGGWGVRISLDAVKISPAFYLQHKFDESKTICGVRST